MLQKSGVKTSSVSPIIYRLFDIQTVVGNGIFVPSTVRPWNLMGLEGSDPASEIGVPAVKSQVGFPTTQVEMTDFGGKNFRATSSQTQVLGLFIHNPPGNDGISPLMELAYLSRCFSSPGGIVLLVSPFGYILMQFHCPKQNEKGNLPKVHVRAKCSGSPMGNPPSKKWRKTPAILQAVI